MGPTVPLESQNATTDHSREPLPPITAARDLASPHSSFNAAKVIAQVFDYQFPQVVAAMDKRKAELDPWHPHAGDSRDLSNCFMKRIPGFRDGKNSVFCAYAKR